MAEYEHRLVYIGSLDEFLADGWEPTPGVAQVTKVFNGHIPQVYVWLRRAAPRG
jgi:hypothetical protein